ncbi:hypothetical protein [Flaviflexus equikiangi]|uniref:Integrase n=1 Tax=Flaviflexus equikiangi TaxID=2758573 RepID=A0ABS2THH7_9ACTO|nr:hypothetical protein [Flaviflexus equikiangi]MBM9434115.1 hypothetical protein [Flaviflexus equikiangi]
MINEQAGVQPASHLLGHTDHSLTFKRHIRRNETFGPTPAGLLEKVFDREA